MLLFSKTVIVLVWIMMFLMIVYAPKKSPWSGEEVIFDATSCGAGLEVILRNILTKIPPAARLLIIDDGSDLLRSRIIERLLIRNPGLVLRINNRSISQCSSIGLES